MGLADASRQVGMMATLRCAVKRRRARGARGTRAAAVVEFAIIFPVLAMLIFGVIDFGRAFFLRNNLVAAAREGARVGAVMTFPCDGTAADAMRARVRAYVTSFGGALPTDAQIPVTTAGGCAAGVPTDVQVGIANYAFTPITPVFRIINYTSALRINVSATYRWEQSPVP
jgi:Flp pilus assembly protein TadG